MVRTAGQVIDDAVLGSLEYSISELKVPLIVVLGHDSCGAITATKGAVEAGQMPTGYIRDLVERITPSVLTSLRNDKPEVNDMVVEHVKQTVRRLADTSHVISDAVIDGRADALSMWEPESQKLVDALGRDAQTKHIPVLGLKRAFGCLLLVAAAKLLLGR